MGKSHGQRGRAGEGSRTPDLRFTSTPLVGDQRDRVAAGRWPITLLDLGVWRPCGVGLDCHPMACLTAEEVEQLLSAARGDRFEALYVLAVSTGARKGELLALRWRNVNLEAGDGERCGQPSPGPGGKTRDRRYEDLHIAPHSCLDAHGGHDPAAAPSRPSATAHRHGAGMARPRLGLQHRQGHGGRPNRPPQEVLPTSARTVRRSTHPLP